RLAQLPPACRGNRRAVGLGNVAEWDGRGGAPEEEAPRGIVRRGGGRRRAARPAGGADTLVRTARAPGPPGDARCPVGGVDRGRGGDRGGCAVGPCRGRGRAAVVGAGQCPDDETGDLLDRG